ncbi:hypothetical protein DS884_18115 [Tenacibaculum sp. E3R01]|nr:hypothetical protein DS884_18115 [Tenacibaculum sp. E3R01]SED64415.1 Type IV pili methyl-accepting chemotaxis transducer N-term [Tenacibaculum sp. MAR_2010_89]
MKKPFFYHSYFALFLITILSLFNSNKSYAQANPKYGMLSFNKAINISEKQSMLIQRMAKDYLYALDNPQNKTVLKDLLTSKIIFEKQNQILKNNSSSTLVKNRIEAVENIWDNFKKLIEKKPSYENAKKIINTNTLLLNASEKIALFISGEANQANKEISHNANFLERDANLKKVIIISGRQRMLAQRLALYYLAKNKNLINKNSKKTLEKTYDEMETLNTPLLISDFDSDMVDEKIAETLTIWDSLKKENLKSKKYSNNEIYKTTNKLTKAYNKITSLYEHTKF